uniref:ornithine decarboxylase n=1 Tax=Esox lucius TaxID=8010 RepID=A0A3P8XMB1_ESOLU
MLSLKNTSVCPFYAVKSNNSPPIIKMLGTVGAGFDCASQGEIEQVLSLGVTPNKIIYAHPCKQESHIRYAQAHGVQIMTFDSEEELVKISRCHDSAKLVLRLGVDDSKALLRLSGKFGAKLGSCQHLLQRAQNLDLEVIGVSFHVGCGCTDSKAYRQAISDAHCVFNIGEELGFKMTLLDIGGGFPGQNDFKLTFEEIAADINKALEEFFPPSCGVSVIAEPGRYYVTSAVTLAANVIAKKVIMEELTNCRTANRTMMYYLNDGVYGSISFLLHDPAQSTVSPYPHRKPKPDEPVYPCVIWGPTCDSVDVVVKNTFLPELQVGDWLLIDNMGAYTHCISTTFNGFRKTPIYYVMSRDTMHWIQLSCTHSLIKPC